MYSTAQSSKIGAERTFAFLLLEPRGGRVERNDGHGVLGDGHRTRGARETGREARRALLRQVVVVARLRLGARTRLVLVRREAQRVQCRLTPRDRAAFTTSHISH